MDDETKLLRELTRLAGGPRKVSKRETRRWLLGLTDANWRTISSFANAPMPDAEMQGRVVDMFLERMKEGFNG